MNRREILEHLLKLISQADSLDTPHLAGEYAGVPPETKRELTELWGDALLTNSWLVPEKVAEFDYQDFREWVRVSSSYFVLGYMLASREQGETEQATRSDPGEPGGRGEQQSP